MASLIDPQDRERMNALLDGANREALAAEVLEPQPGVIETDTSHPAEVAIWLGGEYDNYVRPTPQLFNELEPEPVYVLQRHGEGEDEQVLISQQPGKAFWVSNKTDGLLRRITNARPYEDIRDGLLDLEGIRANTDEEHIRMYNLRAQHLFDQIYAAQPEDAKDPALAMRIAVHQVALGIVMQVDPHVFDGSRDEEFGDELTGAQLYDDLVQAIITYRDSDTVSSPTLEPEPVVEDIEDEEAEEVIEPIHLVIPPARRGARTERGRWVRRGALAGLALIAASFFGHNFIDGSSQHTAAPPAVEQEDEQAPDQTVPDQAAPAPAEHTFPGGETSTRGRDLILAEFARHGVDINDPVELQQATDQLAEYVQIVTQNQEPETVRAEASEEVVEHEAAPVHHEQTEEATAAETPHAEAGTTESRTGAQTDRTVTANERANVRRQVLEAYQANGVDTENPREVARADSELKEYLRAVTTPERDLNNPAYLFGSFAGRQIDFTVPEGSTVLKELNKMTGDRRVAANIANVMRSSGINVDVVAAGQHISFRIPA